MTENLQGPEASAEPTFKKELCQLINKHGIDAKWTIPDYIFANYMYRTLGAVQQLKLELLEHGVKRD